MDAGVLTIGGKTAAVEEEEPVEDTPVADEPHDFGAKGPLGGGVKMVKVSSADGKPKKLTKKQLKQKEYEEKRAELVRLGIMPE